MSKRIKALFGAILGLAILGTGTYALTHSVATPAMVVLAEGEEAPAAEEFECSVVIPVFQHGEIIADKLEGHVGDTVTLDVKHDLFYLVQNVAVNGTALIESETTSGCYTFALAEGENVISAEFVVDQELLGTFSTMYEEASNKDWTKLFSVKNIITIVNFVLNSGILIAIVRYFVKDKRLEGKVEKTIKEVTAQIFDEELKKNLTEQLTNILAPFFSAFTSNQEEIVRVLGVFSKCMALMQEDTPESRMAVLNELANLNIGEMSFIQNAKNTIDEYIRSRNAELGDVLAKLDEIIRNNGGSKHTTPIVEKPAPAPVEEPKPETSDVPDGTQI